MSLPMQKATYKARAIAAATFARAGKNGDGNMQMAIPMQVTDGEFAGVGQAWISTITDNTIDRIVESLMHMGWQGEDLTELAGCSDEMIAKLLPNEVEIVCEPDTYDGKTTLKIRWVNKVGGGRFAFKDPIVGADLKAFGAQLRNTVKSVRAAGGAPRKPAANGGNGSSGGQRTNQRNGQPHPNAPGIGDDDIPPEFR